MRMPRGPVVAGALLLTSCATVGSGDFNRGNPYGAPRPYGLHPGIDFMVDIGTPIIAPADGAVTSTRKSDGPQPWQGGFIVHVSHGEHFDSVNMHLMRIDVQPGQSLRRGQLIGLSGASNSGHAHLHFGICRTGGNCFDYTQTYDPDKFWLGGAPRCYEPRTDYSARSAQGLTLPVACGEYANELLARSKRKD